MLIIGDKPRKNWNQPVRIEFLKTIRRLLTVFFYGDKNLTRVNSY